MKEYRRFVAYVYEYQKEKKGRNCGFIQVEAKEQNCRMEVHLFARGCFRRRSAKFLDLSVTAG